MHTRALLCLVGLTLGLSSLAIAQDAPKPAAQPAAPAAQPSAPAAPAAQPEAVAQPKPAPTLRVGMPAPEFKVEKFVKGEPFTGLEKGRIYVVEFWATWCGPCIMSMPHLSELQREYKDKGVTICSVNVWEDKEYSEGTLPKVEKFVKGKGETMDYTVAFDGAGRVMDTTWMKAAGRNGIPAAFVVDKAGTIAWIGHPSLLDMVLDEVVAGKWDIATGDDRIKTASGVFRSAGEKFKTGLDEGNAAWDAALKEYPLMGRTMKVRRFRAMLEGGHSKEACEIADKIVDDAIQAKNAVPIMEVMGSMGEASMLTTPEAKALLVKAARANFDLSDTTVIGPHVSLARAYFMTGEVEKGRECAKKAVELAPEEVRKSLEEWLKKMEADAPAK